MTEMVDMMERTIERIARTDLMMRSTAQIETLRKLLCDLENNFAMIKEALKVKEGEK